MQSISKQFHFEASHILPRHTGKCRHLHGHSWKLRVEVEGPIDPKTQFIMDYGDLKAVVQPLIDLVDHTHLNRLIRYPSSENIAVWFGIHIQNTLKGKNLLRVSTYVSETEGTWASWHLNDVLVGDGWTAPSADVQNNLETIIGKLESIGK